MSQGLVDESKFKPIDWSKLGVLKRTVLARLEEQARSVVGSERRGIAAHVRQALVEVGVPKELVRLSTMALVQESAFIETVHWNRIGKVRARVLEMLHKQGGRITPALRQELVDSG